MKVIFYISKINITVSFVLHVYLRLNISKNDYKPCTSFFSAKHTSIKYSASLVLLQITLRSIAQKPSSGKSILLALSHKAVLLHTGYLFQRPAEFL